MNEKLLDSKIKQKIDHLDKKLGKPMMIFLTFITWFTIIGLALSLIFYKNPIIGLFGIIPAILLTIKDIKKLYD